MHQHLIRFKNVDMSHLMQNVLFRQNLVKLSIKLVIEFFPNIIDVEFTAQMEKDLDDVEEGNENGLKLLMTFIKILKNMLNLQMKKWKKLKLKMNQLVKIVKNVARRWFINLDDMESLWLAQISQIAEIQKQL